MSRSRAQAVILQQDKILMVNHVERNKGSFWCLPGGGIEAGETPEDAVIREIHEECCVKGKIKRKISEVVHDSGETHYTFLLEISDIPKLGIDPEFNSDSQILKKVDYMAIEDLSEIDRLFLWLFAF